jgi:hypothetical protein
MPRHTGSLDETIDDDTTENSGSTSDIKADKLLTLNNFASTKRNKTLRNGLQLFSQKTSVG